ncbi:MAG: C4-type zinc ribbon domain-containing protein, partial [Bacteroidales bacterium OttesenSCG-928-I14]|nr:C4-type zinc ribbon domain-containing protein [Bacteroidales bacterium OttesenSCG-928-I14]
DIIKTLRGELPSEVKDLENEVIHISTSIENFEKSLVDFKKKINQDKIKITNANNLVKKYNQQIEEIRNNREYNSLFKEIEMQKLDIQLAEKSIRESEGKINLIEEEIKNQNKKNKEIQIELNLKKEELKKIISETEVKETYLLEKAKQIETNIDTSTLLSFNRIRNRAKNGLAVVCIQREACGGCFYKIPPQKQIEIKMQKKIISCEYCGRIIISADLQNKK